MEKINKNIAVIYHYPCYDGAFSCVNLYLYYTNFSNKTNLLYFYPSNSHNRISEVVNTENKIKFSKVYILDKGLNDEDYQQILEWSSSLKFIIIDHHTSSIDLYGEKYAENYKNNKNIKIIFEDKGERAASGLTFDYFYFKSAKIDKNHADLIFNPKWKKLIEYIEDSDIGTYKLQYTHEFKSGLAE
jgi:hypothetical protein